MGLFKRPGQNKWLVRWRDAQGKWKQRAAFTDKAASKALLADLERQSAREAAGLDAPTARRQLPIGKALAEFLDHLRSHRPTPRHVQQCQRRLERLFISAQILKVSDLTASSVERYLTSLDFAGKTLHDIAAVARQFGAWARRVGLLASNPLEDVKQPIRESDKTFQRQALTVEQLQDLVEAAEVRPVQSWRKAYPGATPEALEEFRKRGARRGLTYAVLAFTGLRRGEAKSLKWADLSLDSQPPFLVVRASCSKNRREAALPLPGWLASRLRFERERQSQELGRVVGGADLVLRLAPYNGLLHSLRQDATYAGIPLVDDQGRRLDLHALRHSYCANLARAGVGLKQAMQLMRHSDPKLTAKVYGQLGLTDLAESVERIPTLDRSEGAASLAPKGARRGMEDPNAFSRRHA